MMRFPLMFRASHEALLAAKDEREALAVCHAETWREAYQALAARHDSFVALVADRTVPPPRAEPTAKRESDAVDTAIQWVTGDDKAKRRYLEAWAKGERRQGKDAAGIAASIMDTARGVGADEDDGMSA
jgi:hypothetical protein